MSFTFYIQFILFAGKEALEIKRTFDQFAHAHSSLILNFIAEGHLRAGNKSAQNFIVGEFRDLYYCINQRRTINHPKMAGTIRTTPTIRSQT